MAATEAPRDFAHLVATGVAVERVSMANFAALERNPLDPVNVIDLGASVPEAIRRHTRTISEQSLVVVQLGDNVPPATLGDFVPRYRALLAAAHRGRVLCLSTWWRNSAKDDAMRAACADAGGTFVFIGDIFNDPANPDRAKHVYANEGVNNHPQDWGMRVIADRVLRAALDAS